MTETNANTSVEDEIYNCLDLDSPKSFFLFAGAGSGKTRTLVEVLKKFRENNVRRLRLSGQKVAIITYTNAACDEIKRRLDFDPTFAISTIHSFSWELIKPFQTDIRNWLKPTLQSEIEELEAKQTAGRAGTKAAVDRPRQIASKRARLDSLDSIRKFSYNPNSDNSSRDSLNHTEVIALTADFLLKHNLMQKIVVRKFPILLIDESQDTKKDLIEAFFQVQTAHAKCFTLGMFGDTMQRIYTDGKTDLGQYIPEDWAKPAKTINYRSPKRVIRLINKIRADVDDQTQEAAKTDEEGVVRLFIADTTNVFDKTLFENTVSSEMAKITGDKDWCDTNGGIKVLTLEHHMAATRGGFDSFFKPLYLVDKLKTGLLDGTLPGISLFASQILPLIKAEQAGDKFSVSRLVRTYSPLLTKETLRDTEAPREKIIRARDAVNSLYALCNEGRCPLRDLLKEVYRSGLFQVPDVLLPIASRVDTPNEVTATAPTNALDRDEVIDAWDEALGTSIDRFEAYVRYISDQSRFGTHQGIKGLEFPRVMAILDDDEARGSSFSYAKLFGAEAPTGADRKNEAESKETSIDRTRRLFYVICSRAKKSLAIVAYTKEPKKVKDHALFRGWFEESEII